ncbi:MFS transporter [Kribbella sp. VKM Ac-2568]|uniref:MFS transporter n=1 Tax=Kribbella sp. VKM Ac-2568 TaxID=2512219 RepID=UPI0010451743|nr:MFS transporter [Kribbella sp. VKM Ac-2568]TCM46071.1 MFS transporter [Kribbella sp. VKM Ac-2568]
MNRAYYGWLAGASLSAFGDTAVFFALGWAAAGLGPHVAGLVLTGYTLPRAVLLLAGGVLGDRWGPRRLLLTCYLLLAAVALFLAGAVHLIGTSVALLLLTASTIGTVDAFALPAAGSFPRIFASDEELPRVMALRTSTQQVVTLLGGPAGGLLVAAAGLVGALLVDAFTFLIAFACLAIIKLPRETAPEPAAGSVVKEALDGIRLAWTDPVLSALLLTVGLMAASVLPVTSLCVPLLARSNGWAASQAGLVVGATVAGGLTVTLLVARLGTFAQPARTAAVGCLVAATGVTGLSLASSAYLAALFAAVQGVGIGIFTSHLAPLFVASTPRSHLTRLQSLLALAQTLPLIASTSLLGLVATAGVQLAVLASAAGTALAGATLLAMPRATAAVA